MFEINSLIVDMGNSSGNPARVEVEPKKEVDILGLVDWLDGK
jgi:hypothetical protein